MAMQIYAPAFAQGQAIPVRFSCHGEDVSPALMWSGVPAGTGSLVLIVDDPDAPVGTWDHWLLFNIPPSAAGLPEGVSPDKELGDGSRHGKNSWGKLGYGGPCPPRGTHRYFFKLYALDTVLQLPAASNKKTLLKGMQGHVLAQAELMGTFTRP